MLQHTDLTQNDHAIKWQAYCIAGITVIQTSHITAYTYVHSKDHYSYKHASLSNMLDLIQKDFQMQPWHTDTAL